MTTEASPRDVVPVTESTRIATLESYVGRTANALQAGYQADRADAVAGLARLRRAVPYARQLSPDAWDIFNGMPAQLLGEGDEPSEAEFAAVERLLSLLPPGGALDYRLRRLPTSEFASAAQCS